MSARADAVLFLACDMPFVTAELLHRLARRKVVFCKQDGRAAIAAGQQHLPGR